MRSDGVRNRLIRLAWRAGYSVSKGPAPCRIEAHLRELLRKLDVTVVLDVGGHVGEYADRLRRYSAFAGRIVSFEPEPEAMAQARRRMGGDAGWTGVPLALGREPGRLPLNVHARSAFTSFRSMNDFGVAEYGGEVLRTTEVEVARLDDVVGSYLSRHDRAMLKIDTQGYDLEVIAGARRTIADAVVALQVEVPIRNIYEGAPNLVQMMEVIDELGFDLTWISPFASRPDLRLVECDFVARKRPD